MIRRHDESRVVSDLTVLGNSIIRPSLTESRRVTIGKKGEQVRNARDGGTWRAPVKLDFFQVTLTETDEKQDYVVDWKFHREVLKDDKPRRIPIKLLFDRIQLSAMTYLGLYSGRSAWCKGNGEIASRVDEKNANLRKEVECPCEHLRAGKCKVHLRFQFHLPGMGIGEVAVFRSTGKNTISAILGSLAILKEHVAIACNTSFDQAPIADIPLVMEYLKKTVVDAEGKTRIIPVINVKCMLTREEIRETVFKRQEFYKKTSDDIHRLLDQRAHIEMSREQDQKAKLLAPETAKEAAAINEEFHPELVEGKPEDVGPCKAKQDTDDLQRLQDAAKKVLPQSVIEAMSEAEDEDMDQPPAPPPPKPKVQAAPAPRPTPQKPKEDGDWL
jgi:hypothetical protein